MSPFAEAVTVGILVAVAVAFVLSVAVLILNRRRP